MKPKTIVTKILTVGIPADRDIKWTLRILSGLKNSSIQVNVLVSRWINKPLSAKELQLLNSYFPTKVVLSSGRYAPMMRNTILRHAKSTHILFLDDDMIPDPQLLKNALFLIKREPFIVYQGLPYRVANHTKWLAKMEGKVYEKGYKKYINENVEVALLDARVLLAPVSVLLQTPFDESITFGGEGHVLAKRLIMSGIKLKLSNALVALHINRESVKTLLVQKRFHGRGRGHILLQNGPGDAGWRKYIIYYFSRHYKKPVIEWVGKKLDTSELLYILGTNTIFWLGVFEEILRSIRVRKNRFTQQK